ncbi:MAG: sulfotransferase [Phycisphaeraceae bacterium]|nr:sulfotransferase [Phycisphaerales bacterium]MCB9859896.1 sulfotransferase [Phycisphaeraceae bacterium]
MTIKLGFQQQFQQVRQLCGAGQYHAAVEITRRLIRTKPSDPRVMHLHGIALRGAGIFDESRKTLEKLTRLHPDNAHACNDLSLTYQRLGRWDDALRAVSRAAELEPDNAMIAGVHAECLFSMGEYDACGELLDSCFERGLESQSLGMICGRHALRTGKVDEAINRLERLLERDTLLPAHRATLTFMLAHLLDRADDIDRAFETYVKANTLRDEPFDPAHHRQRVDAMISAWSSSAMESMPRGRLDGSRCVFIVGMPRSATSLVEQILASHPKVAGGGELRALQDIAHSLDPLNERVPIITDTSTLSQFTFDKAAREYLSAIQKVSSSAARVTDKTPANFFHLGLVSRMFAKGKEPRVIHCIRNPVDTCWSCYTQSFSGAVPFAFDLSHLGEFCRDYVRVMEHWKSTLSIPMTDVVYEDLLDDPEAGIRRIIDFAGLDWDDACMKFHENPRVVLTASQDQVRQKLFRSSRERWKRYSTHLGPLIAALGDAAQM